MTHSYFKYRTVRQDNSVTHCVVWNGVKEWEDHPPVEQMVLAGELPGGKMAVVQIACHEMWVDMLVDDAMRKFNSVIFWTRNHKVYKEIIRYQDVMGPRLQ